MRVLPQIFVLMFVMRTGANDALASGNPNEQYVLKGFQEFSNRLNAGFYKKGKLPQYTSVKTQMCEKHQRIRNYLTCVYEFRLSTGEPSIVPLAFRQSNGRWVLREADLIESQRVGQIYKASSGRSLVKKSRNRRFAMFQDPSLDILGPDVIRVYVAPVINGEPADVGKYAIIVSGCNARQNEPGKKMYLQKAQKDGPLKREWRNVKRVPFSAKGQPDYVQVETVRQCRKKLWFNLDAFYRVWFDFELARDQSDPKSKYYFHLIPVKIAKRQDAPKNLGINPNPMPKTFSFANNEHFIPEKEIWGSGSANELLGDGTPGSWVKYNWKKWDNYGWTSATSVKGLGAEVQIKTMVSALDAGSAFYNNILRNGQAASWMNEHIK